MQTIDLEGGILMLKLVEIKALYGYRLWLRYADGVKGGEKKKGQESF
jgi:hypothetical protein